MVEGSRHWKGFAKGSLFTAWLVMGVEACGDTSLVFFSAEGCAAWSSCLCHLHPGSWCQGMDASIPALKA